MEKRFRIKVKTNSNKNKFLGFDKEKDAYIVEIKEPPEDNKANVEIINFLSKTFKKRVRIVSGMKSKEKLIEFV